jgi:hypothetical protein
MNFNDNDDILEIARIVTVAKRDAKNELDVHLGGPTVELERLRQLTDQLHEVEDLGTIAKNLMGKILVAASQRETAESFQEFQALEEEIENLQGDLGRLLWILTHYQAGSAERSHLRETSLVKYGGSILHDTQEARQAGPDSSQLAGLKEKLKTFLSDKLEIFLSDKLDEFVDRELGGDE